MSSTAIVSVNTDSFTKNKNVQMSLLFSNNQMYLRKRTKHHVEKVKQNKEETSGQTLVYL